MRNIVGIIYSTNLAHNRINDRSPPIVIHNTSATSSVLVRKTAKRAVQTTDRMTPWRANSSYYNWTVHCPLVVPADYATVQITSLHGVGCGRWNVGIFSKIVCTDVYRPTRGVLPGFVTSKYTAIVVLGSSPPSPQKLVPPRPTSNSDTLRPCLFGGVTGPIVPATLNSRLVKTSNEAPNAIINFPPSWGISSSNRLKMQGNDSLKTDCPKESPSTINPPVASTSCPISNSPTWSKLQAKTSTTWYTAEGGGGACLPFFFFPSCADNT